MNFIQLTLFRRRDNRPPQKIHVNFNRVQCMEPQLEGTRIQFQLSEPSLMVQESIEDIERKLGMTEQLRRIK